MRKRISSLALISLIGSLAACGAPQPPLGRALSPAQNLSAQGLFGPKATEVRIYRSYGNESSVMLRARVQKPENQRPESPSDIALINFWRNLTSMAVKERAGVKVIFTLNGRSQTFVSDDEGMVQAPVQAFGPLTPGIHSLRAEIAPGQDFKGNSSEEKIVIHPAAEASLGVVSDIDDTIKISSVTNKLTALRRLLFNNAYTSEPIPGVSVLYQRIDARNDGRPDGDIQYLSGSPINLAGTIQRFMDHRGFPQGAIELKKWGFGAGDDSPMAQLSFKTERLRQIFKTYPGRSFLLFGDSGEKDPEIYRQIAAEFPGRVKGIFIHNMTNELPTAPRFLGTHLTKGPHEQARILLANGLLSPDDVAAVEKAFAAQLAYERQHGQ